jgi:hypothetical protein
MARAKKPESKFSELMASRRSTSPPSNSLPDEKVKPIAKSTSEEYIKANFYLPKDLYKQLKALSVELEQDMGDLTAQALQEWMAKRSRV